HEDVGGRQAPAEPLGDRVDLIGDDSEIDGLGPRLDHLRHQRVGVRVRNLARTRLGSEVREFVAGREDRDPWTAKDAHLRVPEGRQQSHFGHGGITARETMGSASTRPSAASTSTRSTESGSTRERICSSASSTVSTSLLYYTAPGSAGGGDGCAPRDHASRYRVG